MKWDTAPRLPDFSAFIASRTLRSTARKAGLGRKGGRHVKSHAMVLRTTSRRSAEPSFNRPLWTSLIAAFAFAAVLLVTAPVAFAAETRAETSTFGSFTDPGTVAVDQSSGNVYVVDYGTSSVLKFDSSGNPANFSALGSNVLDGKKESEDDPLGADYVGGAGGFSFQPSGSTIAVDNSGGPNDGFIYVSSPGNFLVHTFDSSGTYHNNLNGTEVPGGYGYPCDVAVDPNGRVYVSDYSTGIVRYTPKGSPVQNSDFDGKVEALDACGGAAADSNGTVYRTSLDGTVRKFLASDFGTLNPGTVLAEKAIGGLAVDPSTDDLFLGQGNRIIQFDDLGTELASFAAPGFSASKGVAVSNTGATVYATAGSDTKVHVFGALTPGAPFTVEKTGAGSGTVTCDIGTGEIPCDTDLLSGVKVTITAVAAPIGSEFTGWTVDGSAAKCPGVGTCEITLGTDSVVEANFDQIPTHTLTVTLPGGGGGTVKGDVAGSTGKIDCPTICSGDYNAGTKVTLTAAPQPIGSAFAEWIVNGSASTCPGSGPCELTLSAGTTVEAVFDTVTTHTVSVTKSGTGTGSVTGDVQGTNGGISCGSTCVEDYNEGTTVTLTANPNANQKFEGWSGACANVTGPCLLSNLSADASVTATFTKIQHTVSVAIAGTGNGTVTGTTGPISGCATGGAGTCSGAYDAGQTVVLKAERKGHSAFAGWTGACTNSTGDCVLSNLQAAASVTASFDALDPGVVTYTDTEIPAGPGTVHGSYDVSVDPNTGDIYVANRSGGIAQLDSAGNLLNTWTSTEGVWIFGLSYNPQENVNYGFARVGTNLELAPFLADGTMLSLPGFPLDFGPIGTQGARSIEFDGDESIYTVAREAQKIVRYNISNGSVMQEIACTDCPGTGSFNDLSGVALGPDGEIYAADSGALVKAEQSVTIDAAGGSFTLAYGGQSTGSTGTWSFTEGEKEVFGVVKNSGYIEVGEEVFGEGIPAGTLVSKVFGSTVTLSESPTKTAENVSFTTRFPRDAAAATLGFSLRELPALKGIGIGASGPKGGPWTISFGDGKFAETDPELLTADNSHLTGGSKSVSITTTQKCCTKPARLIEFNPNGSFNRIIDEVPAPLAHRSVGIAVDSVTGDIFVTRAGKPDESDFHIVGFDAEGERFADFGQSGPYELNETRQLGVDSRTGAVYLSSSNGKPLVIKYSPEPRLAAWTHGVTGDETSATVRGIVNPNGLPTTQCRFEYGPTAAYGQSSPCSDDPGSASIRTPVSSVITGLSPATEYHYRVVLTTSEGTASGEDKAFTTGAQALPSVSTGGASNVSQTSATLAGSVDPQGGATTCEFQYGPTASYGSVVPCAKDPGSGIGNVSVSAPLTGLEPGVTYHFRLRATNAGGTSEGVDATFATLADTCQTKVSLCPPTPQPPNPPAPNPLTPPTSPGPKPPLKCKKGFKKKKIKGKAKCVKQKKRARKKRR